MKKVVSLMFVLSLFCPSVNAMKAYSYDSNGNRVYREVVGKYSAPKKFVKYSTTQKYTSDYDPRLSSDMYGTTSYVYGSDGKRTGKIKHTGDGRTYVYGADGQRIRSYRTVSNRSINASRVTRVSTRVQPSGAFYR